MSLVVGALLCIPTATPGGGTQVATPTFSPVAGTYTGTQSVTVSCATTGASMFYTTDGSTPTASSTPVSGAISVASSEVLNVLATKAGFTNSNIGSAAYTISAGSLTASANAFSAKVDFPGYTPPGGKTVASIAATGNSPGGIFSSSVGGGGQSSPYTHFPLLSQGQGGSLSSSTTFTLGVIVTFTDATTQNLGNTPSITVPATNGSIIPTNGLMYDSGIFYGKGDFNYGGMLTDYYYNDSGTIVCRCTESTGGGGHQPYWPATSGGAGVDTSAFTHLQFVISASIANPRYIVYFMAFNDVDDGVNVDDIGTNATYGTTTLAQGSYGTYSVPLSTFALGAAKVLKYNIGFQAPQSSGAWFNIKRAALV